MFKVTVLNSRINLATAYLCDLIDHDTHGDIRLYKYDKPELHLASLTQVYKFEAHVEFIQSVEFILGV